MLHHRAFCRDCCTTVCMREGLCTRNRTEHLYKSIRVRDEVATWASERSIQSNSATLLWANVADIYRRNFADTIHRQHRHISWHISVCRYIGWALLTTLLLAVSREGSWNKAGINFKHCTFPGLSGFKPHRWVNSLPWNITVAKYDEGGNPATTTVVHRTVM